MGSGSAILFWYGSCCCGGFIVFLVAWLLFAMGKREELAKREALESQTETKPDDAS